MPDVEPRGDMDDEPTEDTPEEQKTIKATHSTAAGRKLILILPHHDIKHHHERKADGKSYSCDI